MIYTYIHLHMCAYVCVYKNIIKTKDVHYQPLYWPSSYTFNKRLLNSLLFEGLQRYLKYCTHPSKQSQFIKETNTKF